MRGILLTLLLAASSFKFLRSENPITGEALLQKLSMVNTEWSNLAERKQVIGSTTISDDKLFTDWIALHLKLVEQTLRRRNVTALSASQQTKRKRLLDELNCYWQSRLFPVNDYTPDRTPVFIDRTGNHCAVGYLMKQSGAENLAKQINSEQQFAYVRDIKVKGVKEWADKNGITLDELAWIQPNYWPSTVFSQVGGGTNGPLKVVCPDWYQGQLIFAGDFDTIENFPCLNIGYFKNNQLNCFGGGLNGVVNDACNSQFGVIAAGNLQFGGNNFPLAIYDTAGWNFIEIPGRPGAVCHAIFAGGGGYTKEAVISHSLIPGKQEIWYEDNSQAWKVMATVNGGIFDLGFSSSGRIYVGSFDSVVVHRDGLSDTLILAHNVVFKDNYANSWFGIGTDLSDTVLVVKNIGSAIYFGGTCFNTVGKSNICLTRYLNGSLQPLVFSAGFPGISHSIRDIQLYDATNLILGGEFESIPGGIGTYSKNIALFNLALNYMNAFGYFDEKVNTLANWGNTWFLGGQFTSDLGGSLRHLARIGGFNDVQEISINEEILAYPNPASDIIRIEARNNEFILQSELLDVTGRNVFSEMNSSASPNISINKLSSGIYLLRTLTKNGWSATKLIKN